jgi:7-cyano-7-deazaguanine synthase
MNRDKIKIDWKFDRRAARRKFGYKRKPFTRSQTERFNAGEIPGRNLALLSIATLFTHGAQIVALGIHAGTRYFDCSRSFTDQADRLIGECTNGAIALFAPFLHWAKRDIIAYARSEGLDLNLTYSCEAGRMPPCGMCLSCRDRKALLC